ncbi:hydroxyacid dehydrogenase [Sinorhizobium medicae]|uniref:hydroxyacid dehydrogenase n=1 Tax=Sinorhizobium medicae TaxID=110321 RepID=UPI000FD7D584|nr:hydroxyacid dehydrogenase [Sinorhizobium medicae]MDX0494878.1 hydroxyacid dehydrogenase [Sinorhizobium medicae]MDX0994416.1 hydroxyacid dehydrogenase [Sinorhizobium medicae]MDX1178276.1 hydroxyacid dehydrogenase [Sinorhizobium medicae]MDX1202014.1 hydroxyacid dehydrogenase [Sinorhizobium medicae]RVI94692.1 hydroxyacid dehydrogenase [Sinorhizobium medicae]
MSRDIILVDPLPRTVDLIMDPSVKARLHRLGEVVISEDRPMPAEQVDALLPDAVLIFGQTDMPKERLDRARKLKAIINVESNFLPNIDYQTCVERGTWVITPASAFASPVAEASLAMALDLARGITKADRDFRVGAEQYGLAGNEETFRFAGAPVGIIGFGDLGQQLRELIRPFRNHVRVFDPWLPEEIVQRADCVPSSLDELLSESQVVFVFASVTSENEGFIGAREFSLMRKGAAFLLMSRAAVVDFPAMLEAAGSGHIRVATDVFPEEPVAPDHPVRTTPGLLLSAHRTGGTRDAFYALGSMAVADAELIMRGLPPQLCRRADPATVRRLKSKPVTVS